MGFWGFAVVFGSVFICEVEIEALDAVGFTGLGVGSVTALRVEVCVLVVALGRDFERRD